MYIMSQGQALNIFKVQILVSLLPQLCPCKRQIISTSTEEQLNLLRIIHTNHLSALSGKTFSPVSLQQVASHHPDL